MKHLNIIKNICLAGIVVVALAACSSENEIDAPTSMLHLYSPGNSLMLDDQPVNAAVRMVTRAGETHPFKPAGSGSTENVPTFMPYNELYPIPINKDYTTIGAFLTENTNDRYSSTAGYFYYKEDNSWGTTVGIKPGNFYIFGYMPSNASGSATISKRIIDGNPADWSHGCTMVISNLSTVTPADVCVVVGVLKGDADKDAIYADKIVNQIQQGSFAYEGTETDNYVYLLLDHLYTNVNLELSVDPDYSLLRTIVLKQVSMKSETSSTVDATIEIVNNATTPIKTLTFTESIDDSRVASLLFTEERNGIIPVSNDVDNPTSVPGYFAPGMTTQAFDFEFIYDVYDNKGIDSDHPYGNLVRANCHAINHWELDGSGVVSGKSFNVKAKIKPTYLYQLSEPDLDNPTITLNIDPEPEPEPEP